MATERFGIYKTGGKDVTVIGDDIKSGKNRAGLQCSRVGLVSETRLGRYFR